MLWRRIGVPLLVVVFSLAAGLAILEAAVRALGLFAGPRALARQVVSAVDPPAEPQDRFSLPHPFRAFSRVPGGGRPRAGGKPPQGLFPAGQAALGWEESARANVHGFFSDIADYRGVEDDRFVVAILGGSVAGELATVGKDALTRSLTRATPYPRGRAEVLNLASAGYKQPQQVAVLAEMLILGVPLDVVVNLDGFNETALGGSDARAGFHPFFPFRRQYGAVVELSRAAPSGRALELAARVASERRRARELQAAARYPILRSSELAQAVAGLLVRRAEAKAVRLEVLLQSESAGTLASKAVADLPAPCLARGDGCGELIADLWARSSLALHALAREAGAAYLHVLQPTQYLDGSKPLSPEERASAYSPEEEWPRAARFTYPFLQRRGADLKRLGVDFHDLTELFAGRRETIFRDRCCHLNLAGYEILAGAIADRIAAARVSRMRPTERPFRSLR